MISIAKFSFLFLIFSISIATKITYTSLGLDTTIEINEEGMCNITKSGKRFLSFFDPNYKIVPHNELKDILIFCNKTKSSAIFPGTKWCGKGNRALNKDDLGTQFEVDFCCRNHDYCPLYILPGQCKYNICNNSHYTFSHCSCDEKFLRCLNRTQSLIGVIVGNIFARGMYCYRETKPCKDEDDCEIQLSSCSKLDFISLTNYLEKEVIDTINNYL